MARWILGAIIACKRPTLGTGERRRHTFEDGLQIVIGHNHVVFVVHTLVGVEPLWNPLTARQDFVEPALFSYDLYFEDPA